MDNKEKIKEFTEYEKARIEFLKGKAEFLQGCGGCLAIPIILVISNKIGVRICYYRKIIRVLLDVLLIPLSILFCYLLSMSIKKFYAYI